MKKAAPFVEEGMRDNNYQRTVIARRSLSDIRKTLD
jgi:hypothetical protein